MLGRRKPFPHGILSIAVSFFSSFRSLSSSNPSLQNPNFHKRTTLNRNPRNISINKPIDSLTRPLRHTTVAPEFRYDSDSSSLEISQISEKFSSNVTSICSLLFGPIQQNRNLDNLLKDFKNKLNSDLVLEILMNYRQLGRFNTLEFFSWAGFQLGFSFDDSVIEYMADFLGRRKLFDDLKCLLRTVSLSKGRVSCRTVSICIRFLGRQGRVKEALCLFEEMESEFSCVPDNLVFNNILFVLCKKVTSGESIDVAFAIFQRIECPDVFSYSNILVGLCKCGRLESAVEVFYEMGTAGLVPTRTAVNILIGELCELRTKQDSIEKVKVKNFCRPFSILVPNVSTKSSIQPASEVFWAICKLGLLPSAFVITRLISELSRLRKIEKAVEILKVVEDRKLRCVDECYTVVIQALCEVRRIDEACELFGRMVSQGLKPKLVVYNSVICVLCKLGNVEGAEKYFELMNKKRCAPDNVTYTALIHAYCGTKNWEAAYGLLMEMLGFGWCPHFHTYNLVDSLVNRYGRVDLSRKLEGKLDTQLLQKYCKAGKLEAAYEKLSSMISKGFCPPIYTIDIFERAFQKYGKLKLARELLEKMDQVTQRSNSEA
ncbi:uncharacterized protein LOC143862327 [Tasmannia lanceolata]|uniref:uncharacterized protein LOC143862327 n=1 Tax=Tasmannia lanceolata TaxID=3420 RepID=UPI004063ECCA